MEPVGLVLAIVSLTGLFTTYLDLLDTISKTKTYKRDYQRLACRLEVEYVLYLKWVEELALLQSLNPMLVQQFCERRFKGRAVSDSAAEILIYLNENFEDATNLLMKYAPRHMYRPIAEVVYIHASHRLHSASRAIFAKSGVLRPAQNKTSLARKIYWALHDRAKLLELVNEITIFSEDLRWLTRTDGGPIEIAHLRPQLSGSSLPGHSSDHEP